MSSYLSLRAIDEIEDHPQLQKRKKDLLCAISDEFQRRHHLTPVAFAQFFRTCRDEVPEVTKSTDEWAELAQKKFLPASGTRAAKMARRMAYWVSNDWRIRTKLWTLIAIHSVLPGRSAYCSLIYGLV